jgi:signal transduction histidine kinase
MPRNDHKKSLSAGTTEDCEKIFSIQTSGFGLFNIRERMNHINGKFSLSSVPGEGTVVTMETPLDLKQYVIG